MKVLVKDPWKTILLAQKKAPLRNRLQFTFAHHVSVYTFLFYVLLWLLFVLYLHWSSIYRYIQPHHHIHVHGHSREREIAALIHLTYVCSIYCLIKWRPTSDIYEKVCVFELDVCARLSLYDLFYFALEDRNYIQSHRTDTNRHTHTHTLCGRGLLCNAKNLSSTVSMEDATWRFSWVRWLAKRERAENIWFY